jgi:hypothetical protein
LNASLQKQELQSCIEEDQKEKTKDFQSECDPLFQFSVHDDELVKCIQCLNSPSFGCCLVQGCATTTRNKFFSLVFVFHYIKSLHLTHTKHVLFFDLKQTQPTNK